MSDDTALTPAHGSALGLAVLAIMQNLSGEAALIGAHDDNDQVTYGALARVGEKFVVVEQKADAVANLAHTFGLVQDQRDGWRARREV